MHNINVIATLSVPGKTMSDDFMHVVLGNCTAGVVLPTPEEFDSESLPDNLSMTAVDVMKSSEIRGALR